MKLLLAFSLLLHVGAIAGAVIAYREQRAEIRQHRRELDQQHRRWTTLDERHYQLRGDQHQTQREVDDVRDELSDHLESLTKK